MTHHSHGVHPLLMVLLGIPALLALGVLKGCDMAQEAIQGAGQAIEAPAPVKQAPHHHHIKHSEGWDI